MTSEIRIGVLGNVDSGKSTIIGVLNKGILDDGRGKARRNILMHPHEKKSGRTSSITSIYCNNLNYKNNILFIDLAGHEQYLKTTIHGIMGYNIDYIMIVIGSNMGLTKMSIEHLKLIIHLKFKFFIVLTKIDLCPENVLQNTIKDIKIFLNENNINNNIPILSVSSKTGKNIDQLKRLLFNIKNYNKISNFEKSILFTIESKYNVNGVGIVLSGKTLNGNIKKNDKLLLGPINNNFINIMIKSLHDNFRNEINELNIGESGCVNIKNIDKKIIDLKKIKLKKGLYIIKNDSINNCDLLTWSFQAKINIISNHSTTISSNYQPVINCNKISQTARIISIINVNDNNNDNFKDNNNNNFKDNNNDDLYLKNINNDLVNVDFNKFNLKKNKNNNINDNNLIVRTGDISTVIFKFCYRPEIINKNDIFIFREGATKGIGMVINLIN